MTPATRQSFAMAIGLVFLLQATVSGCASGPGDSVSHPAPPNGEQVLVILTLSAAWNRLADRSMVAFARAAGVPDTLAFSICLRSEEVAARVRSDRDDIQRLGPAGTPTLIVNGDVVRGTPSEPELRSIVSRHLRRALRGRT